MKAAEILIDKKQKYAILLSVVNKGVEVYSREVRLSSLAVFFVLPLFTMV
ncbi:MAG: hypothetical protein WC321_05020 [Candidatus Omnitrophota bacterium]|jgi:hypothetical protein